MTIQWISSFEEKQSLVTYRSCQAEGTWLNAMGEALPFPQASQYLIHRVELQNLSPKTEYLFKLLPYKEEYHFTTAPSHLEKELHFVVGGDMYHDEIEIVTKICQKAAATNPTFALVGGDIAYAVRSPIQEIERWVDWVKMWHATMVSPEGRLIPVIPAIGNHDVVGQFDQTPAQAAVFSTLFPMPGERIYNVLDFDSYLSVFILDSGHANPIAGQQTNWLKASLEQRRHVIHRLALYHVPAYPSVRDFQNGYSTTIRYFWVPLFEREGIQVAFEHHDHTYKRTHPLLNHRIDPQGVLYLGDGSWGAKPRACSEDRPYLAKCLSIRHFIAVTLSPSQQRFRCVNEEGQVLDEYVQSINRSSLKVAPNVDSPKPN